MEYKLERGFMRKWQVKRVQVLLFKRGTAFLKKSIFGLVWEENEISIHIYIHQIKTFHVEDDINVKHWGL